MNKTLFSFLLFFMVQSLSAQVTLIPDPNFEQALIDLGFDSDGTINGQVLTADIEGIIQLEVQGYNISDLTGIQDMPVLQTLFCYDNNLSSLDLSGNPILFSLDCTNNAITSIDLSHTPSLWYFYAGFNSISSLDLSGVPLLKRLNMDSNQLSSLDLSNVEELIGCTVSNNLLTEIDFTQNPSIEWFNIRGNSISSLDLGNNLFLEELYLDDNQLTSLDVTQNPVLRNLFVGNNNITTLDLSQNTGLETVAVYNNQLEQLNLKNGNTLSITTLIAQDNSNLECIQVDEDVVGNVPASWSYDAGVTFSDDCMYLGTNNIALNEVHLYPNPTSEMVWIDTPNGTTISSVQIYNIQGQLIQETKSNEVNMIGIEAGCYLLKIEHTHGQTIKRIIKQ